MKRIATKRVILAVICVGGIILSISLLGNLFTPVKANILGAEEIRPEFHFYQDLIRGTNVPVILPTEVPLPDHLSDFFSSVSAASENKYYISLNASDNCNGSGVCSFGSLEGELITTSTRDPEEINQDLLEPSNDSDRPQSDDEMGAVELAKGIEGLFIPWEATAQCSEAEVYWKQDGYQYRVGLECADKSAVVDMANSAINNQPLSE